MENEAVIRLFFKYIVVLVIVYFISKTKCVKCNTPDASQEGALKSFKNYKDITIFHYIVPKETIRATWQFAAFMNNPTCIPRKVNIYLQQGSFPIIVNKNYSFPANFNVSRDNQYFITTETAFETKSMVILPVYSPLPGDWFVGAYLSYWDQQIHQQGLGHKCQYSLGSVATWNRASNVQSITIGLAIPVKTAARESYYKIYIGSNVWSFRVHVWDCKLTLKKFRNSTICIQSMTLRGRAMPNYTNPGAVLNLATNESYTLNERAPFEDSYYYLMIVSESIIEFNIQVSITECPVRNAEMAKWLKASSKPSVLINNDTLQHEYNYYDNSELEYNANYGDNDMSSDNEKCMPRFQLYRIEHTQSFSRDYIFKDDNQLFLSDISPTILQFNILPLTDIGGTLSVDINFNSNKRYSQSMQLVVIDACLDNGHLFKRRNGGILCDNGFSMQVSSNRKQNNLLIPYPVADTWYLSLEAKCFLKSLPIVCDTQKLPMIVNIQLRQCTYAGNYSCGLNGYCHNLQQGLLYYSSCECYGGSEGWACDDDANVSFKSSIWFMTLILTTSNIFFLPAIYIAWKRSFYAETFIYFSTMLFSTLYHACDQDLTRYCVAKYDVLQYLDFFSSTLAFWVTLVAMAEMKIHLVPLAHMIGVIIIAYGVQSDKTGLYNVVLLFVLGLIINICSYSKYYCLNTITWKHSKRLCNFIIGLILVTLGMTCYCVIETEANYYYMHSAWHITIAISLIFLLPPSSSSHKNITVATNSLESFAANDNVDQLDLTKNVNNV